MSKRPKDIEAFERKIRPIYDALDSRNWKGALKLCQQALQKYPNNELVMVLKAIGLDRSGKRDEANQVVDEVVAATPIDEQVLRLASMVLRGSGRLSDITRMYEAAAAAAAASGGSGSAQQALVLLHEVFGAHVRESNFVKQQQVALRLSKAAAGALAAVGAAGVSGERYGWWVVMSLVLQARAALRARARGVPAPAGQVPAVAMEPEKLLALAEGMVARQAAKDGRMEGYEALMVYVDVLLAQGKVAEALSLVSGPLGASALRLPAERLQLRGVLAALAGQLGGAAEALREALGMQSDDWGALLLLLDCLLPGTAAAGGEQKGGVNCGGAGQNADVALFLPRHPLILISGGLAEQLPPRGVEVPADGGATEEAFLRAEAVIKELAALGAEQSAAGSNGNGNGNGNGQPGNDKPMIMRGPDLAMVELAMRRHRAVLCRTTPPPSPDVITDTEAAVVDAVLSYFRKYGSLVSCAVDLRTYVSQLSDAAAERLVAALQVEVEEAAAGAAASGGDNSANGSSGGNKSAALAVLRRRVCVAQIRDDCGLPRLDSTTAGVQLSREFLELYCTARPLQEGLDERERGAADELPVLAAAALVTSATLAAPSDAAAAVPYLLAAYGALSDAVRHRPYGAGMRISAAALATLLAAPAAAAGHLYKLDIKHIQLDSLGGHLLLPPLLAWPVGGSDAASVASGQSSASSSAQVSLHRALRDTRALFEDHARDAGETLFTAYNHGMYTKILEFNAFRERLAAAHTLAVVRSEEVLGDCLNSLRSGAGGAAAGAAAGTGSSTAAGGGSGAAAGADSSAGGGDALHAAAAAVAAGTQRMGEMPTEGSLRFNWDLSTRPTWLPPCAASPSLQPLEWWRSRASGETRGQGYGRCWWSATSAAEATCPAAAAWRAALTSATAHRWLLSHCVAGTAGAGQPGSAAAGPAGPAVSGSASGSDQRLAGTGQLLALKEAVERLRALQPSEEGAGEEEGTASRPGWMLPGSLELRRLDVRLYETVLAVQECLAPTAASAPAASTATMDAAAATRAATNLTALTAAARAAVDAAATEITVAAEAAAAWGGVLPGGALCLLSHLLREPLAVLAACLQSWQASLKALRKRRTKAGAQLEEGAAALGEALTAAAAELAAAARAAGEALAAATGKGEPAAAAAQAVRYLGEQGHAPTCLSDAATSALEALVREQRNTVATLAVHATALTAALT
ncbi:hypothetical protein Agub_g10707 [Astrephomene gubernaculifera]|uniref:Uncharacterized protein n=1 Tax=Astrephomene gubernaculifera TaxID=47775 RepID=A0AAD3DV97_9CHLO|nr:hypothetical protein Agub_g10707 [Astrephomene gubernaculifera]